MIRLRISQDMMQSRKKHCRSFRFAHVAVNTYSKKRLFTTMTNGVVKTANMIFGMTSGKTSWKVWMLMVEEWNAIEGYEGLYEVSNRGQIRSLKRNTSKGKVLKPHNAGKYLQVCLCKNGKTAYKSIHRLVAKAFAPNVNNFPEVNHKDENKFNNSATNLEWCTQIENLAYGTRLERIGHAKSKAVRAFNEAGVLIAEYKSIKEAAEQNGLASINISRCCRGIYKQSRGYIWQFTE